MPCSVGLVADLMRELGLRACQPRAYKRTTVPGEQPVASPDLIGRDFTATAAGQRLVGDITYPRTGEGWLYLATVTGPGHPDGHRLAAGGPHAHQPGHRRPGHGHHPRPHPARGGVHSDKGAQCTSAAFARFCAAHGICTSVGRTGVCWDNAAAESFFAALKNEMSYRQSFPSRARARFSVADYIEVFYNRQRLHSTLGYRTHFEALTQFQAAATAALSTIRETVQDR